MKFSSLRYTPLRFLRKHNMIKRTTTEKLVRFDQEELKIAAS